MFVEGVGAVGLSAHCCMYGGVQLSLEQRRRAVIFADTLYYQLEFNKRCLKLYYYLFFINTLNKINCCPKIFALY